MIPKRMVRWQTAGQLVVKHGRNQLQVHGGLQGIALVAIYYITQGQDTRQRL